MASYLQNPTALVLLTAACSVHSFESDSKYIVLGENDLVRIRDVSVELVPELASSPGVEYSLAEIQDGIVNATVVFQPHSIGHGQAHSILVSCRKDDDWSCSRRGDWVWLQMDSQTKPVILKGKQLDYFAAEDIVNRTIESLRETCGYQQPQVVSMRHHEIGLDIHYVGDEFETIHGSVKYAVDASSSSADLVFGEGDVYCSDDGP